MSNDTPTVTLPPIFASNSQLFRVYVYEADGVTPMATAPTSATCSVWDADTDTNIINEGAGATGTENSRGYAQYNWAGIATAGNYEAVLTVVVSAGVTKSFHFRVEVKSKPPTFTIDLDTDIGEVRNELGDDYEGSGVLPSARNFTDVQIQAALTAEGSAMRAVARLCEQLARRWSNAADTTLGPHSVKYGDIAEKWEKRGRDLRVRYGSGDENSLGGLDVGVIALGFQETVEAGAEDE